VFIHRERLQHLLSPYHYRDEAHYRKEVERLFLPAWHYVATKADLPRPGDFLTLDLLGQPLLVRNLDGEIRAFQNVCAHRHCTLTSLPRGHDERFRCQYHGWEYNKDGATAKIPDAGCFRPWDREHARLKRFRTDTAGEMVFVSLADDGPGLREFLGAYHGLAAESFAPPFRQVWKWETTYNANWKLVTENSLESYHIPLLHAKTFGTMPPEETIEHDLDGRYTTFRTKEMDQRVSAWQNWIVRRLGVTRTTNVYTHHHVHPHLIYTGTDVHRLAQLIVPTSATTTRHVIWLYALRGVSRTPLAWALRPFLTWMVNYVARGVVFEDAPIFERIQKGVNASGHRGVLGTREERLYTFQDYVLRHCGEGRPALRNGD
jgi:phenylpropionate dioxygenase-like ring-hydroxylating dioxygenase large terminal subunit